MFLFLISFIAFTLLNRYLREIKDDYSTLIRMGIYAFMNVGKLVYSALGVMLVYTTMNIIRKKNIILHSYWIRISECCFGVYLIQQFILVYLYDYTSLPSIVNFLWLPWVCFLITLFLSVLLSWLFRQTKLGRLII